MIYNSASQWRGAAHKRVLLFATSGLGKTHVSHILRRSQAWFHYSVDYRIGTRYMAPHIVDNAIKAAMQVPELAQMLRSDSIHIAANVLTEDLTAVSQYLGKPGDPARGGLPYETYVDRQMQFKAAEEAALLDTAAFIERAQSLYGYPHFICDTGGSICEWVDPDDPRDPIMTQLAAQNLMVWIEGSQDHTAELIRRFDLAPKPMAYQPAFLLRVWHDYLVQNQCTAEQVDPDAFIRWTYSQALAHRQPRYKAMAQRWGLTIPAAKMAMVQTAGDFEDVIADALAARTHAP